MEALLFRSQDLDRPPLQYLRGCSVVEAVGSRIREGLDEAALESWENRAAAKAAREFPLYPGLRPRRTARPPLPTPARPTEGLAGDPGCAAGS